MLVLVFAALGADLPRDATGRFVATQPPAEVQQLLATAVERAAESVTWALRPLARPVLEKQATACPAYTVSATPTTFEIQCDGRQKYSWVVGQSGPYVTADGETVQMSLKQAGRAYQLDFVGERGGKSWTYTFPEAGGLVVRQEVNSPHLAAPMVWTLTFRKE